MLLIALHFASCLSALTLLIGESWRVRYALIRCFAILQRPASDGGIRKTSVQPARLPGQMVLHQLPLTSARSRCEREQASPGNLEDVWPGRAALDRPSTPVPPLQPSLQTDSPGPCSAASHLWTHRLASGAHDTPTSVEDTATSSTRTTILVK